MDLDGGIGPVDVEKFGLEWRVKRWVVLAMGAGFQIFCQFLRGDGVGFSTFGGRGIALWPLFDFWPESPFWHLEFVFC
jgi:hypothetical protein